MSHSWCCVCGLGECSHRLSRLIYRPFFLAGKRVASIASIGIALLKQLKHFVSGANPGAHFQAGTETWELHRNHDRNPIPVGPDGQMLIMRDGLGSYSNINSRIHMYVSRHPVGDKRSRAHPCQCTAHLPPQAHRLFQGVHPPRGPPLGAETEKVRWHLIKCIFLHAKVAIQTGASL